jgi:hypothetical protein
MMIEQLLDQIHAKYPEAACSIQEKDGTIFFFDKHGLPKLSLVIKQIVQNPFGSPTVIVDLFDYDKKLVEENV